MSKRLDSTWKKWSEPVNLPSPINSPKWDAYFTMDAKADYAYLASSQNSVGGTDLVRIKLDESIMPKPVAIIYGRMINAATMQPVDSDVYYDVVGASRDKSINTTPVDGKYKMVLPYGTKYTLRVGSEEFMPLTDTLDLAVVGPFKEIYRDVYLNPVAVVKTMQADSSAVVVRKDLDDVNLDTEVINEGDIINMNAVLFDYSKPILRAVSFNQIQKVISYMKQNPDVKIELAAHTDNVGSPKYNLLLSQDRAYAVAQYFIHGGITMNRIVPKGYGETVPVASNNTDAGKQQNRRVEFKILKK
jgi:outer membrane protein OmpA-like peptidoglycan-associated protein